MNADEFDRLWAEGVRLGMDLPDAAKESVRTFVNQRVPVGWKIVPREPTLAMLDAAGMGRVIKCSEMRKRVRIYKAMLAAAPRQGEKA